MSIDNWERLVGFVGIIVPMVIWFAVTKRWEKALKQGGTVTPKKIAFRVDKDGEERQDAA